MRSRTTILTAFALCALSLALVAVPAFADIADPVASSGGFPVIAIVAVVVAIGACAAIFKRKS